MLNKKSIVISIFFAVAFLIYFSSINASFQFDDDRNIVSNTSIKIKDLSPGALMKAAGTDVKAGLRPIPYVSFALNYYFSGLDTTSYHAVNILLHALSAFLIYLIILALFDYDKADDEKKGKLALSAFFTALFWLVTPINSQTVIYIVQRMTLLMTLFFLLAFLFYVKGRKLKRAKYFVFSGIFFLLSFLSKQNAIILPLVIILYELIFERGGELKNVTRNEKIIFILLTIILLLPLFIFWSQIDSLFANAYDGWGFTYYERALTQFRVLVFYLSLIILPLPGRLSLLHHITKSTSPFSPVTTIFSIILILGLFAIAILRIKKSPYFSFALLWFFITMSVEAILPIEMVYEHRIYMPGIFLMGAAVSYVTDRFYGKNRQVLISAFCVIIIILGGLTSVRGKAWESDLSIWSDVVQKFPEEIRESIGKISKHDGMNENDIAEYYLTLEPKVRSKWATFSSNVAIAYNNLGSAYTKQGQYKLAVRSYFLSIEYTYNRHLPYYNLGAVYFEQGDYKRAARSYQKAVDYAPNDLDTCLKLSDACYMSNDYDNAIKALENVIRLDPDLPIAYVILGNIYKNRKRFNLAEQNLFKAIELDENEENNRYIYADLGELFFIQNKLIRSRVMYKKMFEYGIENNAQYVNAFLVFGKTYISSGDYEEAIINFKKSIEIGLKMKPVYDDIGSIYAILGATYKVLKKYELALVSLNEAKKYRPDDKIIKENLRVVNYYLNQ
jgi:tetratricopeptide (TPR) repeat protein